MLIMTKWMPSSSAWRRHCCGCHPMRQRDRETRRQHLPISRPRRPYPPQQRRKAGCLSCSKGDAGVWRS